jgi:hypothetical protein
MAVGLQGIIFIILYFTLPDFPPKQRNLKYHQILWTMGKFMLTEPVLVQACLNGMLTSAVFASFWTTLTFLLGNDPYDYSRYHPTSHLQLTQSRNRSVRINRYPGSLHCSPRRSLRRSSNPLDRCPHRTIHSSNRSNHSHLGRYHFRRRGRNPHLCPRCWPTDATSLQSNARICNLRSGSCTAQRVLYNFPVYWTGDGFQGGDTGVYVGRV